MNAKIEQLTAGEQEWIMQQIVTAHEFVQRTLNKVGGKPLRRNGPRLRPGMRRRLRRLMDYFRQVHQAAVVTIPKAEQRFIGVER